MSKLGKSFKNKLLRQALALVLTGAMVTSGIPVTAAEASTELSTEDASDTNAEASVETSGKEESAEAAEQEQKEETESSEEENEETEASEETKASEIKASETTEEETESSETEASETETSETEALETEASETEGNKTSDTSTYASTEGNSEEFVKYNLEGFADSYGVTGGGLLTTSNSNYYRCTTEKEFLDALKTVKSKKTTPTVIEITTDMELGNLELDAQSDITFSEYSSVIKADGHTPLLHPTLKKTGVSDLYLQDISNLTIFSQNGSAIKHCDIIVKRTNNLIIRNITFDELWEWDEETTGAYDRNDWDYIGIEGSDGIWIDHCTFYKSYDGIVDIKNPNTTSNVTISWCRFLPASEKKDGAYPFFDTMMEYLEENKDSLAYYGDELRTTDGLTAEQVRQYAYGQKKTHLLGQGDTATNAAGIKLTLANNYYHDSMDRMPRLRYGTVHEYNCVLDAQELYGWKTSGNSTLKDKITSNGALSTCGGKMLLENCYINGINNPLISGNDGSAPGSINAVNSVYYKNDKEETLEPQNNNNDTYIQDKCNGVRPDPLITDADEFVRDLPYTDYIKYNASSLNDGIVPLTGAGKLEMSEAQWEKTSYGLRQPATEPGDDTPGGGEGSGGNEGDESVISFSLRADDIEWINITQDSKGNDQRELSEDYSKNGFTIKATKDKTIIVAGSNKTIEGIAFSRCIKLGGAGNESERSIHFTAPSEGTLTVYVVSASSKDSNRKCILYKADGTIVDGNGEKQSVPTSAPASQTLKIAEPGDYYIAGSAGINIYYIAFSNQIEDEDEPTEDEPTEVPYPDEEAENYPAFSAPAGDSVYETADAAEASLVKYNLEGYAAAANVTGGGLLKEDSENYYEVTNEQEFIDALNSVRSLGTTETGGLKPTNEITPAVIEIKKDLNLGYLELLNQGIDITQKPAKTVIEKQTEQPLIHPTLLKTGTSYIKLNWFHNLTIYSKNGATIKHCGIKFEGQSNNIIVRNLTFDELWEWDEGGTNSKGKPCKAGDYDRNDWDYMDIEDDAEGIWIDHCTFYKSYDGIIDLKNKKDPKGYQRVTISWCEVLPGSKDNTFFNEQMTWLENNMDSTTYYKQLRTTEKMSAKDVWWYAYGQKKTHLFGSDDGDTQDKAIHVTLANNYYKDAMSRLPRLRFGKAHEYNCVLDSQELDEQYRAGNSHITGNGAISACDGRLLLENCYIKGLRSPLKSGMAVDDTGYIGAINSIYDYNGTTTTTIEATRKDGSDTKLMDADRFKANLPYTATTYEASTLNEVVVPYVGAGKLTMTTAQWEATNYKAESEDDDEPGSETPGDNESESESESEPASEPGSEPGSEPSTGGETDESGLKIQFVNSADNGKYTYTGSKIEPEIEVRNNGKLLTQGVDYTVKYSNNINAPANSAKQPTITVTGKGILAGKAVKTFTIERKDISEGVTAAKLLAVKGKKISAPAVYFGGTKLKAGKDFAYETTKSYTAVGTEKLKINGIGNFAGTLELDVQVFEDVNAMKQAAKKFTVKVNKDKANKLVYTGASLAEQIESCIEVTGASENEYVKVLPENTVNAGTVKFTVAGLGDYSGCSVSGSIKILPKTITDSDIVITNSSDGIAEYTSTGATLDLSVMYNNALLTNGKDYTVKYSSNKKVGKTGMYTITFKGNYKGKYTSRSAFTIAKADLKNAKVSVADKVCAAKGGNAKSAPYVTLNGAVVKVSEYTVAYKVGDAAYAATPKLTVTSFGSNDFVDVTVKITPKENGNYKLSEGELTGTYKVWKKEASGVQDLSKAKIILTGGNKCQYTGWAVKPEVRVMLGTKNVAEQCEITYVNNVNIGKATIIVNPDAEKGAGLIGSKTKAFSIVSQVITGKEADIWVNAANIINDSLRELFK